MKIPQAAYTVARLNRLHGVCDAYVSSGSISMIEFQDSQYIVRGIINTVKLTKFDKGSRIH